MIEFRNVTMSFNEDVVLRGISFAILRGQTEIILGVSGSGKSTILKLILGLIKPDSGEILIDGEDITGMSDQELVGVRQKIGMVFQDGALFDSMSVRENVGYRFYDQRRMTEEQVEAAVRQLLGFVGLEEAIDKMPAELSGGMKRRVGVARALLGTPEIILYDEPTAGLDPITKRSIVELMVKLRDLRGVTSVFVTHDLRAAGIVATEYAVTDAHGEISVRRDGDHRSLMNVHFTVLQDSEIGFQGSYQDLKDSKEPHIRKFLL